jgi:hypothetical protein
VSIGPEQADELVGMFNTWRRDYWLPIETNREFALHFRKPNAWVRLFRDIRMAFRRFLRREGPVTIVPDRQSISSTTILPHAATPTALAKSRIDESRHGDRGRGGRAEPVGLAGGGTALSADS